MAARGLPSYTVGKNNPPVWISSLILIMAYVTFLIYDNILEEIQLVFISD